MSLLASPREPNVSALPRDPPPWWSVALALLAALILQSDVAPLVPFRGAIPSFVLLLVLWYGLRSNAVSGLLLGTIAGACEDALAGSTGAAWTIATALAGAFAGRTAGTFVADSNELLAGYVVAATFFRYALYAIVLRFEGISLALPITHLHALVWQSLLNALIAYAALRAAPRLSVSDVVGVR